MRLKSIINLFFIAFSGGNAFSLHMTTPVQQKQKLFTTLWKFSRPHTLIGTNLCIPSLYLYAAPQQAALFTPTILSSILYTIVCSGFINLYITGLNQITDMEIDRINKPYLPIVSGEMTRKGRSCDCPFQSLVRSRHGGKVILSLLDVCGGMVIYTGNVVFAPPIPSKTLSVFCSSLYYCRPWNYY